MSLSYPPIETSPTLNAMMGVMATGFGNVDNPPSEGTVWVTLDMIEKFRKQYDSTLTQMPDGSVKVHYFKVTK